MGFEWFISRRYLKSKRKQGFISLISIISIAGVALGVAALIIVLSVMNGFQRDWRDRILGVTAHIVFQSYDGPMTGWGPLMGQLEEVDGVVAATPFAYSQSMISARGRISGAQIRGVDPVTAGRVNLVKKSMVSHDLKRLIRVPSLLAKGTDLPAIVVGVELAKDLGVGLGDRVRLISPFGEETPVGRKPKAQDFIVSDLFKSGMYEYDASLVLLSLKTAQRFLNLGDAVTGIELKTADIYKADQVSDRIKQRFSRPYYSRSWTKRYSNLFSALKLEKTAMFIILTLIVLVAAFNIVSTLIMVVMSKSKDIAILKSMGAARKSVMKVFIYQGLTIGLTGAALGLGLGLGACELLRRYKFIQLPADVYYITTLPVQVDLLDVTVICAAALLVCFAATIYPSRQAAKLEPVEALRYE